MKKITLRVNDEQYKILIDGSDRTGLSIQGFMEKLIETSGPLMRIQFGINPEQRPFLGRSGDR